MLPQDATSDWVCVSQEKEQGEGFSSLSVDDGKEVGRKSFNTAFTSSKYEEECIHITKLKCIKMCFVFFILLKVEKNL